MFKVKGLICPKLLPIMGVIYSESTQLEEVEKALAESRTTLAQMNISIGTKRAAADTAEADATTYKAMVRPWHSLDGLSDTLAPPGARLEVEMHFFAMHPCGSCALGSVKRVPNI